MNTIDRVIEVADFSQLKLSFFERRKIRKLSDKIEKMFARRDYFTLVYGIDYDKNLTSDHCLALASSLVAKHPSFAVIPFRLDNIVFITCFKNDSSRIDYQRLVASAAEQYGDYLNDAWSFAKSRQAPDYILTSVFIGQFDSVRQWMQQYLGVEIEPYPWHYLDSAGQNLFRRAHIENVTCMLR